MLWKIIKPIKLLICFSFTIYAYSYQNLPPPYNELEEILPFNNHGWYINGAALEKIIRNRNVKVIIELGSWLGLSTRHMATLLPENGVVYAVDHWLGGPDHQKDSPIYETELRDLLPILYEQFLSNVIHAKLTNKIIPIRMATQEAACVFKKKMIYPDLIYIDASHDEESVYNDLKAYYPLVKGHGILCGDDWGWGKDFPVMRAVKRFAKENKLRIETPNNWLWVLYEKNH